MRTHNRAGGGVSGRTKAYGHRDDLQGLRTPPLARPSRNNNTKLITDFDRATVLAYRPGNETLSVRTPLSKEDSSLQAAALAKPVPRIVRAI
jgi:hypothetical protein